MKRSGAGGQATVEYIFLLAFAVMLITILGKLGVKPIMLRISSAVSAKIDAMFANEDAFHHLRLGR